MAAMGNVNGADEKILENGTNFFIPILRWEHNVLISPHITFPHNKLAGAVVVDNHCMICQGWTLGE